MRRTKLKVQGLPLPSPFVGGGGQGKSTKVGKEMDAWRSKGEGKEGG